MKILFLGAEVAPYVSVGGLSQVMYFLPRALISHGHDVRIFTPLYGAMKKNESPKKKWTLRTEISDLSVPIKNSYSPMAKGVLLEEELRTNGILSKLGVEKGKKQSLLQEESQDDSDGTIECSIYSHSNRKRDATTYFLGNSEYYGLRANVFGYADDHIRYALMCKGALEWLRRLSEEQKTSRSPAWWPDIIHCHDWHASYFIDLAKRDSRYKALLEKIPIVLTVHNFKFQGNGSFKYINETERDRGTSPLASLTAPELQKQNALKRGLLYADAITTVSVTHAAEIMLPEYAEGLDETLHQVRGKLSGILNGLDVEEFNPATDPLIEKTFTIRNFISSRLKNKADLQRRFLLKHDVTQPLIAFTGRLSKQKGLDLMIEALPHFFKEYTKAQFILLGGGDETYVQQFIALQKQFPDRIGLHLQPNFRLPRKFFSGADIQLVPSMFEPGGLVALEALRYGAVPLVRRTGGLNDIVTDFDPETRQGNGFSFSNKDPWAFYGALIKTLTTYRMPKVWSRLVQNCLECDFSWTHAARSYEHWYRQSAEMKKRARKKLPHSAYVTPIY